MKSLLMCVLFGALIALAGVFCELWTLPYLAKLPTYRSLKLKERVQAFSSEKSPENHQELFKRSLADAPLQEGVSGVSSRRVNDLRDAEGQLDRR